MSRRRIEFTLQTRRLHLARLVFERFLPFTLVLCEVRMPPTMCSVRRSSSLLTVACLLLLLGSAYARAQSGVAAVGGVVMDPDAKVVPNAAVVVRNDLTGQVS